MANSELSIQCSNPHCKTYNSIDRLFCQKCKTPVIKRYLWAIGEKYSETTEQKSNLQTRTIVTAANNPPNDVSVSSQKELTLPAIASEEGRYIEISDRIFLDTEPTETPIIPENIPPDIVDYLKLFSLFPRVPQVYGQLDNTDWLLDYGTVPIDEEGKLIFSSLLPKITTLWAKASPLKQINWLRQIASLWQPLFDRGVAATLLNPDLIGVNGGFIQLLELEKDHQSKSDLQNLGKLWQKWSIEANADVKDVLIHLSDRIATGSINRIKNIIKILDRTLEHYASSYKYSYEVFAISDSGLARKNNQDTAYPDSKEPIKTDGSQTSLAIICDGVGGHEGGEIASTETVNYLQKSILKMHWDKYNSPKKVFKKLVQFIGEANDLISQRNDSEQRKDRQRMGTTLVMALARNHEVYITHVGDSRLYLITNNSCHQITTDDDLASREVRLGYALYRDALNYPSGGALIQALGMRDSVALHPNIQRLVIDDECLLLLCSDGLSDFDRVEQYWQTIITPVLNEKISLQKAVQTLIKLGNKKNGHDNITVALVHCQIQPSQNAVTAITWADVEASFDGLLMWTEENIGDDVPNLAAVANSVNSDSTSTNLETTNKENKAIKKKSKLFLSTIIGFSFVILFGLCFLIYANNKNKNDSQNDTFQSFFYSKSAKKFS